MPLLEVTLGRFLTEFSRLVRSEQYAGLLLLPQPASAISAPAATAASAVRPKGRRDVSIRRRDVSILLLSSMASGYGAEQASASAKKDETTAPTMICVRDAAESISHGQDPLRVADFAALDLLRQPTPGTCRALAREAAFVVWVPSLRR